MCLFEPLFPVPGDIYLGAELLDHVVMPHVTFLRNHQIAFRPWLYHVTFPPATHKGSGFSTCLSPLVIFQFLKILAILVGVQRPLTVLCSDSHLPKDSRCRAPFQVLVRRRIRVCSSPLPVLRLGNLGLLVLLLLPLNCGSSLSILDTGLTSDI